VSEIPEEMRSRAACPQAHFSLQPHDLRRWADALEAAEVANARLRGALETIALPYSWGKRGFNAIKIAKQALGQDVSGFPTHAEAEDENPD